MEGVLSPPPQSVSQICEGLLDGVPEQHQISHEPDSGGDDSRHPAINRAR
jgi:hypothetical protein